MKNKMLLSLAALAGFAMMFIPGLAQTSGCMQGNCPTPPKSSATTGQANEKEQPPADRKTGAEQKPTDRSLQRSNPDNREKK